MSTKTIHIERSTLFDQVWKQPLKDVSVGYGLTPAELKRVAQALAVPLPPLGHWTKVEHGKGMPQPPLPEFDGETTHTVTQWVNDTEVEVAKRFGAAQEQVERATPALPDMRTALGDCLPIVKRMAARLKKGYPDTRGWPSVSLLGHFEVSVAPQNQERALLTLDRVIRHCQAAGITYVSDENERDPAMFVVDDLKFTLRIFESGKRQERALTDKEKAELKANPTGYHYFPARYTFHPTNQLRLEVHGTIYRSVEFTVQDGADAPLADRIADVPTRLRECALAEKLRQQVRAEESSRREERQRAHARLVDAKREQLERLKKFEELALQSERAARLRLLASAMEAGVGQGAEKTHEEVAWLRNAADWLDPIVGKHWPVVDDVSDHYRY